MATQTSTLKTPPPQLRDAIENAAAKFHVPADLLAGIWRVESASSYPNPYGLANGYGGLFGTSNWAAGPKIEVNPNLFTTKTPTPTQDQADTAASVLAGSLRSNSYDIASALHTYSGGGYTSVPGQTTTGKWNPDQASGAQSQDSTVPGSDSSGNSGPVATAVSGAVSGAGEKVGDAVNFVKGGWLGGLEKWVQGEATTALAYALFAFLGVALIGFGLLDLLGYSPRRVVGGVAGSAAKVAAA